MMTLIELIKANRALYKKYFNKDICEKYKKMKELNFMHLHIVLFASL